MKATVRATITREQVAHEQWFARVDAGPFDSHAAAREWFERNLPGVTPTAANGD